VSVNEQMTKKVRFIPTFKGASVKVAFIVAGMLGEQ